MKTENQIKAVLKSLKRSNKKEPTKEKKITIKTLEYVLEKRNGIFS